MSATNFYFFEDFNDGVLNSGNWTYRLPNYIEETGGYMRLDQAVTDIHLSAKYTFDEPVFDPTVTFVALNHDSNNRYMGTTVLSFTTTDGDYLHVNFSMLKNPYLGGLDGDISNYNLPRLQIDHPDQAYYDRYFSTGDSSSSYMDTWTTTTISVDSETGYVLVDVESDGLPDIEFYDERLIGAELEYVLFTPYGWYTGHYMLVDELTVTGRTSLETETPVSTGFTMPIGDRNGLWITEARQSVDGWLDSWYNASDFGDAHNGANHLGEDWNLDDLDGDGTDEDDTGQPVYAASEGKVVYVGDYYGASGSSAGFGQTVVIEHVLPDGQVVYTLYAHLQAGSILVEEGQIIDSDDLEGGFQIGAIGETGAAEGPHLHFELFGVSGATGAFEDEPWRLAMNEFAYVATDIPDDAAFHTETYSNGSVTWYDPSDFIQASVGFDIEDPIVISAGNGGETISGGDGSDDLNGGNGGDVVYGNDGADIISGGNGGDQVFGGSGSDYLLGGNGKDQLFGGADADQIDGGNANDTIDGGSGNDILLGGKGDDVFVFDLTEGPSGDDIILDLSGSDTIRVVGGPASFADLAFESRVDGVVVHLANQSSILLSGVDPSGVIEDQFLFV